MLRECCPVILVMSWTFDHLTWFHGSQSGGRECERWGQIEQEIYTCCH